MVRVHVVKAGEYLDQIAHRLGVDPVALWNDPKNAELKKLREDGNLLCPGDLLYYKPPPSNPCELKVEDTNTVEARVPEARVDLRLVLEGKAISDEPYVVEGINPPLTGTTGADGSLSFSVPVTTGVVRLVLEARGIERTLLIGHLDPIDEIRGAQQRLMALGYLSDAPTGQTDAPMREAVRSFQESNGLPPTGELDGDTLANLEKAYGC